jgi:hypothetical protein
MTIILEDIKTSIGILPDNLGFDSELLMFINSAKSSLIQLGVVELDIEIDEETEWPEFPNGEMLSLSKHYISVKVRQTFDPIPSETISKTISSAAMELEGRIAHEVAEVLDVG